jgi:hypothetical protein
MSKHINSKDKTPGIYTMWQKISKDGGKRLLTENLYGKIVMQEAFSHRLGKG